MELKKDYKVQLKAGCRWIDCSGELTSVDATSLYLRLSNSNPNGTYRVVEVTVFDNFPQPDPTTAL